MFYNCKGFFILTVKLKINLASGIHSIVYVICLILPCERLLLMSIYIVLDSQCISLLHIIERSCSCCLLEKSYSGFNVYSCSFSVCLVHMVEMPCYIIMSCEKCILILCDYYIT
jgi:hypothetical protein